MSVSTNVPARTIAVGWGAGGSAGVAAGEGVEARFGDRVEVTLGEGVEEKVGNTVAVVELLTRVDSGVGDAVFVGSAGAGVAV
jgi:hypothetical protein